MRRTGPIFGRCGVASEAVAGPGLAAGADVVVQSLHKAAGAVLGQSAGWCCCRGKRVEPEALWRGLPPGCRPPKPQVPVLLAPWRRPLPASQSARRAFKLQRAPWLAARVARRLETAGLAGSVANQDPLSAGAEHGRLGAVNAWCRRTGLRVGVGVIAELARPGLSHLLSGAGAHRPL